MKHDLIYLYIKYGNYQHKCSVNNATLNRFFSLHYILPFLLAALVVAHLIAQILVGEGPF